MAEYQMVREIKNQCPNNQMRDIFFKEVETDDPVGYIHKLLKGRVEDLTAETKADGTVVALYETVFSHRLNVGCRPACDLVGIRKFFNL